MVRPWSWSCAQYSSAGSRWPDHTIACPALWMRLASSIPCSYVVEGRTLASANATPWKVLWLSFRTMTRQAPPLPSPGRRGRVLRAGAWVAIAGRAEVRPFRLTVPVPDEAADRERDDDGERE